MPFFSLDSTPLSLPPYFSPLSHLSPQTLPLSLSSLFLPTLSSFTPDSTPLSLPLRLSPQTLCHFLPGLYPSFSSPQALSSFTPGSTPLSLPATLLSLLSLLPAGDWLPVHKVWGSLASHRVLLSHSLCTLPQESSHQTLSPLCNSSTQRQVDAVMCKNRKGLAVGCLLAICAISGLLALILSLVGIKNIYLLSPNKYGIVFDAGSSHTSLYVYQWPADKENDTGIVNQIYTCEVPGKGISSYADSPALAGESLRSCMNEALKIIPAPRQKETTTLLGATAGMRLLREQNETQTQRIFEEIAKTLSTYPVSFQGARILSGNEEGSLGWITVNYLLGTFIMHSYTDNWIHPQAAAMLGAMDLGGASTQMTFHPSVPIRDQSTAMKFRLYGYNYTIYTHSYLCYGQDQALKRLLVTLIQKSSSVVSHPCYPRGYRETVTLASVYNSPCVPQYSGDLQGNITVEGTGQPGECRSAFRDLFNLTGCEKDCSFNGVYQPPVEGKFYAFSAFYYTFNFLNLTCGPSLSTAEAAIWEYCTRNWSSLLDAHPLENRKRLSEYCNSAMYILTLLLDGYRFDNQTWKNIQFSKQAGSADIGWTLGYMLNLTNMIPSEAPALAKAHEYNVWVAAIFFIVLSLTAALVAAPLHCICRNT